MNDDQGYAIFSLEQDDKYKLMYEHKIHFVTNKHIENGQLLDENELE